MTTNRKQLLKFQKKHEFIRYEIFIRATVKIQLDICRKIIQDDGEWVFY